MGEVWTRITEFVGFRFVPSFVDLITAQFGTTEPRTLYVDSVNGLDTNSGFFADKPLATIDAALALVPKRLRHLIKIILAPGNYQGFSLNGWVVDPAPGVNAAGIMIIGTHVTATLAQGSATGTITSSVTGNQATPTYTTVTDSTQNWAVDALKGLQVMIGTTPVTIISNTATQLTLASTSAFGNVAYTIQDWGTIITTPITQPGPLIQSSLTPTAQNAGIAVRNNYFGVTNSCIIESIRMNLAVTGASVSVQNNVGPITFYRVKIGSPTTSGMTISGSQVSFNTSVSAVGSTLTGLTLSGGGNNSMSLNGSLVTTTGSGVQGNTGLQCQGSQMVVSLINTQIDRHNFGIKTPGVAAATLTFFGATIDTNNASQCILASALGHSNYGMTVIQGTGLECRNSSAGLYVGGNIHVWVDSLRGTGNTVGIIMDRGARVQLGASSNITGTTEVQMDSVNQTLADMRAASPRLLKNDYGTILFE